MAKNALSYKPATNGMLAPRVRAGQIKLAKARLMIEDQDARADLSTEPDLSDFPDWACQFFGANLSTEDIDSARTEDDDWLGLDAEDHGLSDEEWEEMKRLNEKHGTDYYRDEDLITLRRLDGQRWFEKNHGQDVSRGAQIDTSDVDDSDPEEDEGADTENQNIIWFEVDEVAVPSQTSVQHNDSVKVLRWWAEKYQHYGESHGKFGRQNKFWRRAIRQNRGHRRQFWGDALDETQDLASHFESILKDFAEFEAFRADQELYVLDQAYRNGEFDHFPPMRPFSYFFDEDWGWDDDRFWEMPKQAPAPEPNGKEVAANDDHLWSEIDEAEERARLDRLIDAASIHQHGGHRGLRAIKGTVRNLSRPHHFLAVA